ncbi:hypothetical protein ACSBR1_015770 [Camellia fascicularis]
MISCSALDLSYNNFSEMSQPSPCKSNLEFADWMTACQSKQYSLHINCGGARTTIGNIIYEADEDVGSPTEFLSVSPNWGTSTSGLFWDTDIDGIYVAKKKSIITMDDSQLYTNARLSHLSLTYYRHRLANGQYTVTLHFAEIILRNSQSFQSLGRCIFDVFIQKGRSRSNTSREQDLRGLELQTGLFIFRQIQDATNNYDEANKIGKSGFGSVYRGVLLDGTVIVAKQLSSKSKQGNREFVNEIGMISGPEECQLELDWPTRVRICIGIARGLAFLHEESRLKIVHRDIKATNILLDMDLNPKISDFGLAKLDEDENTHTSTRIAGTIGYMTPEYALWGHLTHKALALRKKGNLVELMDPKLGSNFNKEEATQIIKVALSCTNPSSVVRLTMFAVVRMLEGDICVEELMMDQSEYGDDLRYKSLRDKYYELQCQNSSEGQTLIDLSETARNGSSSTTFHDLYPISLDSH